MRPLHQLSTALCAAVCASTANVVVGQQSSSGGSDSGSFVKLRERLAPGPGDVLANLDEYDKFWIGECWKEK